MQSLGDLQAMLHRRELLEQNDLEFPTLRRRRNELRAWESARLARTYDHLYRDPRYARALAFCLKDLYGMRDIARRTRELVGAWERLRLALPEAAVELLRRAVEFEVLRDELDHAMASRLERALPITEAGYAAAYRAVGLRGAREQQVDLLYAMAGDIGRAASNPLMGLTLRAAYVPAHVAGFGLLHRLLERGYAAFHDMHGPSDLLNVIREREILLMERLFAGVDDPFGTEHCRHQLQFNA